MPRSAQAIIRTYGDYIDDVGVECAIHFAYWMLLQKFEQNDDDDADADDDEMRCVRMSQTTIILVQTNSGDSIKPFRALFFFFLYHQSFILSLSRTKAQEMHIAI